MAPARLRFFYASSAALSLLGTSAFFAACALSDDSDSSSPDASAYEAALPEEDGRTPDATSGQICREGRRRCVGLELEVCEGKRWISLQSCLPDEWCDVAVGICRMVDAGPDARPDAASNDGGEDAGDGSETGPDDSGS